ncbi:ATP-binding protein [Deminuibacter soli]|uniref:histidine kinase n=1 Tax=Deminuibacter soli TaxID=2291815 RepID=A0A3E1NLL4_9BACT|nr:HAMP domain-containing sensor histidine kinase [Deminuibacter soli]RFM28802.1 sensor histidine kinase [Deminuibacter soli]
MTIQKFVRHNYKRIDAYSGINQVRQDLLQGEVFAVQDKETIIGLLSWYDIAAKPYNLVIDCISRKPPVFTHQSVEEVFNLMQQHNAEALLVYQQQTCVGMIYKKDLTAHFRYALLEQAEITKTIVHDIRNYISNISSITEIVTKQQRKKETAELLSYAAAACHSSLELLQELLFLDQLEQYDENRQRQPVNVHTLLQECVHTVTASATQKQITINYVATKLEWHVLGDTASLKRAFLNILNNAVKFTRVKGQITVTASAKKNQHIIVSVKDNGIGIPPNMKDRIFDKFTRVKRKGTLGEESTGLGMYITRQIVEMYAGNIRVESVENRGSVFLVEFPLLPTA